MTADNPLLQPWTTPFGVPPFEAIAASHFEPAFEAALADHEREIAAIAEDPAPPSFANTLEAFERSGRALDRVSSVFFNLTGANTSDELEAIELRIAPKLSRHYSAIYLNGALFARIDALAKAPPAGLSEEQARVLDRYHTAFVRSGAALDEATKKRLAAISERLATLGTSFGQNVLADEKGWSLVLEEGDDIAGLPDFLLAAAAQAAKERDLPGKYVITLSRSSIEPFLQFSARRDLREKAFRAWAARGEAGKTDNRGIIAETIALRAEQAKLLGFQSFAHFRLDDSMAKTPDAAMGLLNSVWKPARERAVAEREALASLARSEGADIEIETWDWRYYSEKRRKAEFDLDESLLKPYLQLEKVIEAAFETATRLFGVTFAERPDIPVYHPDVRAFEVRGPDGALTGIFLGDYFARPSKRSGAWMSSYRSQEKLEGEIRPTIVNVMNFAKGGAGEPALLSFDDAKTLFHEFGHGLHGLLSDVTYPLLAGTNVARDFVEFPSQLYEHWFERPEILEKFAVHYRTGEPIPAPLLGRLKASRTFNQGFATVEYVASALVDLEMHLLPDGGNLDPIAFEKRVLDEIGLPKGLAMRHRTPHFQHVFAGDGYSSAYYSYLWSETLDADGFLAFEEAGNIFDPETAGRLRDFVYSAGNRRRPDEAYRAFRGRDPDPKALLAKRGLMETAV